MTSTEQRPTRKPDRPGPAQVWQAYLPSVAMTFYAVVLALLVGALLIIFSTPRVIESLQYFFSYPWDFFRYSASAVWDAYSALVQGSVGSWGSWQITLERAAPLICAGLGVSLAFRSGLFNIGARGQMFLGATVAGFIGFHFDLPPGLHALIAAVGAVLAGAAWGGIAGLLKAVTGAHEVITTIMLNYVAAFLVLYLLGKNAFQRPHSNNLLSPPVHSSAALPQIAGVHVGVPIAVLAAVGVWWLLGRSTLGFEMRAVGANPDAARTAGMRVSRVYFVAMAIAGGLAGLAAVMQVLGQRAPLSDSVVGNVGFDAITVALLGRATPLGTVLAGLLFGALSAGGLAMQAAAGVPSDLSDVLQALIVLFVAAPALVRAVLRVPAKGEGTGLQATGWAS